MHNASPLACTSCRAKLTLGSSSCRAHTTDAATPYPVAPVSGLRPGPGHGSGRQPGRGIALGSPAEHWGRWGWPPKQQ
eukprot:13509995-Alexandrium_andersonii.AAC.1